MLQHGWLDDLRRCVADGVPAVLVTVARADGSAPREAGAKLVVTHDDNRGTIGGGNLEWRAIETARALLDDASRAQSRQLLRLPLGPSLGQCCGGVVTLAFERIGAADRDWLDALERALAAGRATVRNVTFAALPRGVELSDAATGAQGAGPACLLWDGAGFDDSTALLTETIAPAGLTVIIFGAGHVGKALVHVLASLPCSVTWVDERDAMFPMIDLPSVRTENLVAPETIIDHAPPHACFLLMTHSHALDERLAEYILRRGDYAYLGLIGSDTKRKLFERRLAARGIEAAQLARMVCPIGIEGIASKRPEAIAVAVAAQLLQVAETLERPAAAP